MTLLIHSALLTSDLNLMVWRCVIVWDCCLALIFEQPGILLIDWLFCTQHYLQHCHHSLSIMNVWKMYLKTLIYDHYAQTPCCLFSWLTSVSLLVFVQWALHAAAMRVVTPPVGSTVRPSSGQTRLPPCPRSTQSKSTVRVTALSCSTASATSPSPTRYVALLTVSLSTASRPITSAKRGQRR